MDNFETFVMRHGEQGVQSILENWERFNGIRHGRVMTLEDRWAYFMAETAQVALAA